MKDLVIDNLQLKLGHGYTFDYRLEIDDINKLNLRRYPCEIRATNFQAKLHRQGLKTKCLTTCVDQLYNRNLCNCTALKAFDADAKFQDCQYAIFREPMQNAR